MPIVRLPPAVSRWVGAFILLLGSVGFALCGFIAHTTLEEARALAASGIQTRAVVTGLSISGKRKSSHNLGYRFRVGDKDAGADHRRIPPARYHELEIGDEIPVRFDPANPHRHITAPELEQLERWGERIGFPFLSLAFLVWSYAHFRDRPREKRQASIAKAAQRRPKSQKKRR